MNERIGQNQAWTGEYWIYHFTVYLPPVTLTRITDRKSLLQLVNTDV